MRRVVVAAFALIALATPALASAHPLGNFTVNRFAGIEVAGSAIYLRYALDVAEIPTYQLGSEIKKPGYPQRLGRRLFVTVDGRVTPLEVLEHRAVERPGAGGLKTLRLDVVYRVLGAGEHVAFRDGSFPERAGWREVTLSARNGARVLGSDVPSVSASDVLRSYPSDLLRSPADVTRADATVVLGERAGPRPTLSAMRPRAHRAGGFEGLIAGGNVSVGVLLVSLIVAAFWGAAHALTPGHGKAMVAAYLIGTKGTPRDAFLLGGTVTVAHTAGVFALGIVTLGLSTLIVPEQLYPWLTLASGILVVLVGASVLRLRLRSRDDAPHDHDHSHHGHGHGHDHEHVHDHVHARDQGLSSKGILGIGVAAGLLPCPSALVVLLSAIALHRIGLGLALIAAFSLGLAATITAIGLLAVLARRTFGRLALDGPFVRALPSVSAALIVAVGLVITARALPGVV